MSASKSDAVASIAGATFICGSLDLLGASLLASLAGRGPIQVLQSIAGALLGRATYDGGLRSAGIGLLLHFGIMAMMAAAYVLIVQRIPWFARHSLLGGAIYGVALYAVMYLIVLPLRWPALFPTAAVEDVIGQLACHIFLVGIPMAVSVNLIRSFDSSIG